MAVRPYSSEYDAGSAAGEATGGGIAGKAFLWIAWALAAAFWGLTLTTAFGIAGAMGHRAVEPPGPGGMDAGGLSWMLINVVGGMLILGGAIAYGAYRYATRNKALDPMTEAATHAEYDMIEDSGGDQAVTRSPEARRPDERDAYRAIEGGPAAPGSP